MATKINQDYYGDSSTWIRIYADLKRSPKTVYTLANSGTYEGGAFDYSASPWGIGKSSASAYFTMIFTRGANWQYNTIERQKTNTPLFLYYATEATTAGAYSGQLTGSDNNMWNFDLTCFKTRISPNINADNNELKSTLSADEGANVNFSGLKGLSPITQCIYQRTKAFIDHVYYKPVGANTINRCSFTDIINNTVSVDKIIYFDIALWSDDIYSVLPTIGANEIDVCEAFKTVYYGEVDKIVNPARQILCWGYWHNNSSFVASYNFYYNTSDTTTPQSSFETFGTNPVIYNNGFAGYSTMSSYNQEFDDVSYHWEYGVTYYNYQNQFDINKIENGSAYTSTPIQAFAYLELDDYDENLTKNQAYVRAILHEVAFLGFPVIASVNDRYKSIGDNDVYLPVFDEEHWITTGEFINGSASLSLPNATWQDIFSDSMPEYDPTYDPDVPPVPPTPGEDDRGDLYNQGARRFFWNNLNVHLLPSANYDQFIQKLNALNMTDPDNETWQLQFKGLNPTDYVVGAYVSFVKPPKTTATTIMLGPVDMNQTEYVYDDTSSNAGFFTFGTRDVLPFYYDFRDYEPYTKIEVYLPLCGTVELETAYFMGASLKIDYYYDIYTMSCTACLYRVKQGQELLYKTVNGTIGAQIPMLSANMGAYQNQIKSLENALKQNELKLMTSTAALAAGVIAAPLTSGTSLLAAGTAALSGAAGLANSIQKQTELEYQIEHLQPSVSVTGSADPQTSLCVGQLMPKLIIKRAKMLPNYDQELYSKTIGHACCINDILGYVEGDTESPRSGLVVCSSADTSGINMLIGEDTYISPTADEVNMIKQALSSGVIL